MQSARYSNYLRFFCSVKFGSYKSVRMSRLTLRLNKDDLDKLEKHK